MALKHNQRFQGIQKVPAFLRDTLTDAQDVPLALSETCLEEEHNGKGVW